jgi:UDP-N-acetylglucosamine transferase subunit ALG13
LIIVLFGTNPYSFDRLAKAVEEYAQTFGEEIVAQLGNTIYHPKGVKCYSFLSHEELLSLIDKAEIVITQGGFGSIMDCLEHRKRIVAVPRRKELRECKDVFGQEELIRELEEEGKIIGLYDTTDLAVAIEKARTLQPKFDPNTKIPNLILNFVKSVMG